MATTETPSTGFGCHGEWNRNARVTDHDRLVGGGQVLSAGYYAAILYGLGGKASATARGPGENPRLLPPSF